jgi:hypothetical protein
MTDLPAGWQPDPSGKHDHRYWDGTAWTDNVADAGVASTDPYVEAPAAPTEPTAVTPAPTGDPTDTYPTAPAAPAAPTAYAPPAPTAGGGGGGSKVGLIVGGAILAAVILAVIAFMAFGDDDSDDGERASNETEDTSDAGSADEGSEDGSSDEGTSGDEDLDDLASACEDGDFEACDDLYLQSDFGSDLEELGSTCGGIADPQYGNCAATNGGEESATPDLGIDPDDLEGFDAETLAEIYESTFGLSSEEATCLAEGLLEVSQDPEAAEDIFTIFSDCGVSMEELNNL